MDHLAAIRTFLRVAALESFSEAARQLGLPKSLVTKRVNYLEQHLGTPLLARTTRRVRLTESGSLYQPRALALVEELEALEQSLGAAHVQLRGLVRISSPTSFGVRYLGPALSGFLCAHPNLAAEVLLNDRLVNPAEEGYDLVLTDHPVISGQFQEEPMCELALVVCAAPSYLERAGTPGEPAALREHDVIHYSHYPSGHDWRFESAEGASARVTVQPRLTTNNGSIMRGAALDGYGIAVLPRFVVETDLAAGSLREVLPGWRPPLARLKAVLPRRRDVVPKTRLLLAHLRERFAALGLTAPMPR